MHLWMMPPTMMISTAPSPLDRVLLLTPKTTQRGAHGGNTSVMGMRNETHGGRIKINKGEVHRLCQASCLHELSIL